MVALATRTLDGMGFALARFRVVRRVAWERLGGCAAALVAALALSGVDALVTLTVVVAIIAVVLALEGMRLRDIRASLREG